MAREIKQEDALEHIRTIQKSMADFNQKYLSFIGLGFSSESACCPGCPGCPDLVWQLRLLRRRRACSGAGALALGACGGLAVVAVIFGLALRQGWQGAGALLHLAGLGLCDTRLKLQGPGSSAQKI